MQACASAARLGWVLISLSCLSAAGADPPAKRALLVGISEYDRGDPKSKWSDLSGGRDVAALREILIRKFGFVEPDGIRTLTTPEETTHQSIVETFRAFLIEPAQPGDIVYFHYSGHGNQHEDQEGGDEQGDGYDETLVPSDWGAEPDCNEILDDELNQLLDDLKEKQPANVTVTFDCCHSGSATRGGRTAIRGLGAPRKAAAARGQGREHGAGSMLARGRADDLGYVVISATRDQDLAYETFDEDNEPIGLLTSCWIKALDEAGPQTTYRDVYERLREVVSAENPYQIPQLAGDQDKLLMAGTALPPEPYVLAKCLGAAELELQAGTLQGMTEGSRFALYKPDTKDFRTAEPLAEADITEVDLITAFLGLTDEYADQVDLSELQTVRAVEVAHQYGDNRLKLDVASVASLPQGAELLEQLRDLPLLNTEPRARDDWDVRVVAKPGREPRGGDEAPLLVLQRADETVIAEVAAEQDVAAKIREALERESRWRFVKSLENMDPSSLIRLEMRLVAVDVKENARGAVIPDSEKAKELSRSEGGETVLSPGEYVMVQLRNTGDVDAYVTLLDLRPDGAIGPLWPHPRRRLPEGSNLIPAGGADAEWWTIPRHYFRIDKPAGVETFRAIGTATPTDYRPVVDLSLRGRGKRGPNTPLARLLEAAADGTRAETAMVASSDWATASVTFTVAQTEE